MASQENSLLEVALVSATVLLAGVMVGFTLSHRLDTNGKLPDQLPQCPLGGRQVVPGHSFLHVVEKLLVAWMVLAVYNTLNFSLMRSLNSAVWWIAIPITAMNSSVWGVAYPQIARATCNFLASMPERLNDARIDTVRVANYLGG